uniref:Uncharacterized protein n=1 Tax=Anguilla anguilla TaxID=7936 RepID=A0A0E9T1H4_ANGAN
MFTLRGPFEWNHKEWRVSPSTYH